MKPQGFPGQLRLRRRAEFLRVQRTGQKHHMRHFLVFVTGRRPGVGRPDQRLPEAAQPTRLGVTVTRRVGGAVTRNRIKRLVREAFRRERSLFVDGFDMVWVAKNTAATVDFDDVAQQMAMMRGRLARTSVGVRA